ncbi:DUF3231 family protein [Bacillus sp. B15-48]|uniref:DUF3231 family protein n=1 Tax=Bacillus sp. B15-48 TaxID=1548601 RepID=UPI00193FE114|nr:DUF3231 family protein [Bacillus sp. B15-48]MBM4761489.1 DUF3231 family protein [Bacillus sp. B15-48]
MDKRLTSAEIAQLLAQYLNDTGSICILSYFLEKVEDKEIKPLIELALHMSNAHIEKLTELFKAEKHAIP